MRKVRATGGIQLEAIALLSPSIVSTVILVSTLSLLRRPMFMLITKNSSFLVFGDKFNEDANELHTAHGR